MAGPIRKPQATGALILGIIEIVCGLIIIILSVVLSSEASVGANMSPYWAGIVFAVPGIIGIVTYFTKNHCAMIAFMVLNIIAFVLQGIGAILVGIVVAVWATVVNDVTNYCRQESSTTCTCYYDGGQFTVKGIENCEELSTMVYIMIGIMVFLIIAALVTLVASILGCISVCCSRNEQPGTIVVRQQNY